MVRVMGKLNLPIPQFILRRRLVIEMETNNERHQMTISGVDEDNTPVTFLKSVKLAYNRRLIRSEPFAIGFRGSLESGTELKVELEFMGHYNEPNLEVTYEYHDVADARTLYLLAYDPTSGEWKTTKEDQESGNSIIDLTDDTTILSDTISNVAF